MTQTTAVALVDEPEPLQAGHRRLALRYSAARLGVIAATVSVLAVFPSFRLAGGLLLVAAVAYANGSNDVSKAIATLVGSGVSNYSRAISWGTAATVLGAGLSAYTGAGLVATFSKGLLSAGTPATLALALGVIAGTVGWVSIATRLALPVSTTHAAIGSIIGVGAVAFGTGHVQWGAAGQKVLLPLLLSPVLGVV
ncbi:MAG: inorganic phosphate transporter, partial [Candidatus Dormibacteria bacterium]